MLSSTEVAGWGVNDHVLMIALKKAHFLKVVVSLRLVHKYALMQYTVSVP